MSQTVKMKPPVQTAIEQTFSLTLMLTRNCNMRCSYCYTSCKTNEVMDCDTAQTAIDRMIEGIPANGLLDCNFFGGEPLLEADMIRQLQQYAQNQAEKRDITVRFNITTNGTVRTAAAESVMLDPDTAITISCDGSQENHNQFRQMADGTASHHRVLETITWLHNRHIPFVVNMVIRPETVHAFTDNLQWFVKQGITVINPSLDMWADWQREDLSVLAEEIYRAAEYWSAITPDCGITWFDEKAALLRGEITREMLACGFGKTEIAIDPAGKEYACERLINNNPLKQRAPVRLGNPMEQCHRCSLQPFCSTSCHCSNLVRTGNPLTPDPLLCVWQKNTIQAIAAVLTSKQNNCERKEDV